MSKPKHTPSLEERYDLLHARITLDGRAAIITGYKTEFAKVCAQAHPFHKVEFSWSAVKRIIETNKGRFKS